MTVCLYHDEVLLNYSTVSVVQWNTSVVLTFDAIQKSILLEGGNVTIIVF